VPIDPDRALAARFGDVSFAWTADDVIRYHLAIGAGFPSCSGAELQYVYEKVLAVAGTFAVVPASAASEPALRAPGIDHDPLRVVHGEHEIELFGKLPVAASSTNTARITAVHDKGTAASVSVTVETRVADELLARNTFTLLLPGAGGFGGDRGVSVGASPPDRPADLVFAVATLPQQAALYRMTGDRTPVHIDFGAARAAGFARPPVQGLCTWAMVAKGVLELERDADPGALLGFAARFAGPVYPGETLEVSLWRGDGEHAVSARVVERDAAALSRGRIRLRP
jgi:acyl dehydratase